MTTLEQALASGHGTERVFHCPVHDDRHASASVNVVKGVWHCYSCGAGGRIDEVVESVEDAMFSVEIDDLLDVEHETYSERWLDQFDAGHSVHPYWLSRFSEEACRFFRLGYDHGTGTATIPMRDPAGKVLGVVRRALDGSSPKYRYPYGVSKSGLLFGYDALQTRQRVVVVEGGMDVVACWEAGVYAVGLYGAQLHARQLQLLHRLEPDEVVLALDNDSAGHTATWGRLSAQGDRLPGIVERCALEGLRVRSVVWGDREAKDVADLEVVERLALIEG